MLLALATPPACSIRLIEAHSTTKQFVDPQGRAQIVSVTLSNDGTAWITPQNPVTIRVSANGVETTRPATVSKLGPGERTDVEVGIDSGGAAAHAVSGAVTAAFANGCSTTNPAELTAGVPRYTSDPASLSKHEAPDWFSNAKFGIFIHWGVYSVPAFGKVGDYAEWYWHSIHDSSSLSFRHQKQTYGRNSKYDDFIPSFTASRFDPKAWVDLFHDAGARYFVLTSKHHEGFALFKTATTRRNAVQMGPHRDLVAALFTASRKYHPNDLHPGLYYSLYEWYNPAYTGEPVANWYGGDPVPYTGMKPIKSYVDQHMLPQMNEIIDQYHPAVVWCDGEWEKDAAYWHDAATIAHYYNSALERGEGVAIDDRCRVDGVREENQTVYDFSTPEYRTYDKTVAHKWEASRGMGFSYGYNAQEHPKDYKTAGELVGMLVDMVSKNGNLLLDIGPKADGTIPAIMEQRLRDIGSWLRVNGEAIYDSHYWWRAAEDGDLRFTVKPNDAFYIISLKKPGAQVVVNQPVPIADSDKLTLLGYSGAPLAWHRDGAKLVIDVPEAARESGHYAWTFKVAW